MLIRADLHIHSCLSPCGDDGMTPCDIAGISKLNGLDLFALTDHNSAKNCPAAALAAAEYGIGFIPGVEVTTSEDIHCVCLFPSVEAAMDFDKYLEKRLPPIVNRPDIFGRQIIVKPDGLEEEFKTLLISGCDISVMDLPSVIRAFGGVCYPAHIDREANGLLTTLGAWPDGLDSTAAEIRFALPGGLPDGLKIIRGSDSHTMADLPDGGFGLPLDTPDFNGLKKYIGGG